jgi:hypothetical protein
MRGAVNLRDACTQAQRDAGLLIGRTLAQAQRRCCCCACEDKGGR